MTTKVKVVFCSPFPHNDDLKDGFMQRVKDIDEHFKEVPRVYLEIGLRRNIVAKKKSYNKNVVVIKLNLFLHFIIITQLFKRTHNVYMHSIYNGIRILPFIYLFKNKNLILDFHGVVPEELKFRNMPIKSFIFNIAEKIIFKYVKKVIFVTKAMQLYVTKKYGDKYTFNSFIYSIFPSNTFIEPEKSAVKKIKDELNITDEDVVIIYSGNMQTWQNIDLMLQHIKKLTEKRYKFILLTGEKKNLEMKLKDMDLDNKLNIFVKSVHPSELSAYYQIAHYGFILRDEHILNKVANPTKLVEYLYYGIVPIVKYKYIGDYAEYGYENIMLSELTNQLLPVKSNINRKIAKHLMHENNEFNCQSLME